MLLETEYTKSIESLKISNEDKMVTFRDSKFKMSKERCQKRVDGDDDDEEVKDKDKNKASKKSETEDSGEKMINSVLVRMMPINWLIRNDKSFLDLVPIIDKAAEKNQALLETSFVSSLLDVFWDAYKNKIMWEQFIPFLLY